MLGIVNLLIAVFISNAFFQLNHHYLWTTSSVIYKVVLSMGWWRICRIAGAQNCLLKIMSFRQLFCISQTLEFPQFYHVSLAELCVVLIKIFEKVHLINSQANLRNNPLALKDFSRNVNT